MIFGDFKETWAVAKSLESLLSKIRHCRLYIQMVSQAIIHTSMAWKRFSFQGAHQRGSVHFCTSHWEKCCFVSVVHTVKNEFGELCFFFNSRLLTKRPCCPQGVGRMCRKSLGWKWPLYVSHALDGNIMRDKNLRALKHFTPYSTPRSAEMNVFFFIKI